LADKGIGKIKEKIEQGKELSFQVLPGGLVAMGKQVYLPESKVLKDKILKEAYESRFTTHPRSTKMYKDLKEFYWWPNIKEGDSRICVKIWDVSTCEDRTPKASGGIATATNSKMKMGKYSH
jgi:hypothetical protein